MNVRRTNRIFCLGLSFLLCAFLPLASVQAQENAPEDALSQEFKYIDLLQQLRMPDIADEVIADAKKVYPEAGTQFKVREIKGLLSQGKFDDVKKVVDAMPDKTSAEYWALTLAMADAYYAFQKYADADKLYLEFFKKVEKPLPALVSFYRDSAYKYAQMLLYLGKDREALDAYRRVFKVPLEEGVERQVHADMAELMLKLAPDLPKKEEKAAFLKEAEGIADKLLWKQDIWFGKAIVMKAHIILLRGDVKGAQELVENYMPQLKIIHDSLREQEKEGEQGMLRMSPMPECRYLLALLLMNEALAEAKKEGGSDDRIKDLLLGERDPQTKARKQNGAFNHFSNVFIRFPESQWASEAGERCETIRKLVKERFKADLRTPVTAEQINKVRAVQFADAKSVFSQNQFKEAVDKLLIVLNKYPDVPEAIPALGDLARCYIELPDDLYTEVVIGHLAEQFCRNPELQETAGSELMRVAEYYGERKMEQKRKQVYDTYLRNYRDHSLVPPTLMRFGELAFQQQDFGTALGYYQQITASYTNSTFYFDALNRTAQIYEDSGNHTNAINALSEFVQQTESRGRPGPALVSAKYRLALGQKNLAVAALRADTTGDPTDRMRELLKVASSFDQLAKLISDPAGPFSKTSADRERNAATLEAALFNKAYCLQTVTKPADKLPALQKMAVDSYLDLATRFPKSKYVPGALMQAGSIRSLAGDSAGANTLFERLRKDYPESAEAKNVLFEMGRRFLDMGYRAQAVETFKKMFLEQGNYSDTQILLAGQELLKAKEYELAGQAFDRVAGSTKDQAQRTSAQLGKAEVQIAQEQFAAAIPVLTSLATALKGSSRLVDVNLILSRAASEQGMRESDASKRQDCFNSAVVAMKVVKTYRTNLQERAATDLEVGRLLTRKARAEEKFGTPEGVRKAKGQSANAYQALIMSADPSNALIAPVLEEAYHESLPLMVEIKRWQDVFDDCNAYLEAFPSGKYAADVRNMRNQASIELSVSGDSKAPAPAGEPGK